MAISEAKKKSNYKWDRQNMCNLAIRLRRSYAEEIKEACRASGVTPSQIMRKAVDDFMEEYRKSQSGSAGTN